MIIRTYRRDDARDVANLIRETFSKFNRKEGTPAAVQAYIDHYDYFAHREEIDRSFSFRSPIFYVAVNNDRVVGMVRGDRGRVFNWFVLGKYHGQGIGRRLMERFESEAMRRGSYEIRVRASLYAVPFYHRLGYKRTTGVRNFRRIGGIKIQPMRKKLK